MIKNKPTKTAPKAVKIASLAFDSAVLVKRLLGEVPERARDVLVRRFGLGVTPERETLEAIGDRSSITRERVRQIEVAGLEAVEGSKAFRDATPAFDELRTVVASLGAVVHEEDLLAHLAKDEKSRNRMRFILVVGSAFYRERETDDFYARWHIDEATAHAVHTALSKLYNSLDDSEVVTEDALLNRFLDELKEVNEAYKSEEVLKRWLALSKHIGKNPLAEWGRVTAPAIRTKGVRDYAYLAIKRQGKPMHFSEVASAIGTLFSKKAHIATTHNELIKDPRFVLVGRGLYALSEWGYNPGVVRDVIREVLSSKGPLKKDEVIAHVKKARFVKDNTILVNLNDSRYFKRLKDGRYAAA